MTPCQGRFVSGAMGVVLAQVVCHFTGGRRSPSAMVLVGQAGALPCRRAGSPAASRGRAAPERAAGRANGRRDGVAPRPASRRDRRAAHPALAPAHAGPGQQLDGAGVAARRVRRRPRGRGRPVTSSQRHTTVSSRSQLGQPRGRRVGARRRPAKRRSRVRAARGRRPAARVGSGAGEPGRDRAAGDLPLGQRQFRAADAGRLARRADAGHGGALVVVHRARRGSVE